MTTKTQAVLSALRGTGLTTASATELGEFSLASTVRRLRKSGVVITDEWISGESRYGRPVKWKKYYSPASAKTT